MDLPSAFIGGNPQQFLAPISGPTPGLEADAPRHVYRPRAFHLEAYVDEQVFRFNVRGDNDGGRFVKVLKGADRRRVTYEKLTKSHGLWRLKTGRAARATIR